MIWLSRLILNPRCREVQRDLGDCQALHRTVMAAYPTVHGDSADARARCGVLFRLDRGTRGPARLTLLVQSTVLPEWSRLPAGYLLEAGGALPNPACKRVDERYQLLDVGTVLLFRLRANPTRKIDTLSSPDGSRRNGKRVELRDEGQQVAWLQRKGEEGGFRLRTVARRQDVPAVQATADKITGTRVDARSGNSSAQARLTFASVLFDGTLEITDRERFQATLANGIGTGKAYGFGLLSVARPTE